MNVMVKEKLLILRKDARYARARKSREIRRS